MIRKNLLLIIILFIAAYFRFNGINWDQNQHLHPDERFMTMVANALSWPQSINQYFDTGLSPLNPHNKGFDFYVYGTLPLFLVKSASALLNFDNYRDLTLVGRFISALLDTGTVFLIYLITQKLFSKKSVSLLASFFYAVSVLPIQLSHFFTTDPFLVFFLTLAFYFLITFSPVLLGISLGLAISSKISAVILLPVIAFGFLFHKNKILSVLLFSLSLFITVRIAQPYLFDGFNINPKVVANLKQLNYWNQPNLYYPPATQWLNYPRSTYALENLILWGIGLPLGVISLISVPDVLIKYRRHPEILLIPIFIIGLFTYQVLQFAQPMRYFYPIYPFLAITSALFISRWRRLVWLVVPLVLIWPLSFNSIYTHANSRVAASDWIYQNIPPGSTLSCEYWDDCLPLGQSLYRTIQLSPYNKDTPIKLTGIDYIILSSNRLYGSIMTVPEAYPYAAKFYTALFNGTLGFKKIAEFTSRPNLPVPGLKLCLTPPGIRYGKVAYSAQDCPLSGISFVDDYADETFTVYDHPKVLIFKKVF